MTPFLQFIFVLAALLLLAKLGGYLSTLVGQPSVLGELIMGILLGPSLVDVLHLPFLTDHLLGEMIAHLSEMGVLLLMFVAGLELEISELARSRRVSALAGFLGVLFPVILGAGTGLIFGMPIEEAIFLGLALGATSVSISAQTLMELKVLRSRVGLGLLGAAVFDDILVILLLSGFLAIVSGEGGVLQLLLIFVRMLAFFGLSAAFGIWVLPRMVRIVSRLPVSQSVLTLALVVMLVYAIAAELVGGMAAITGTFLAGLMFGRSPEKDRLERGVHAFSYSFFVPIFFVHVGLSIDLKLLQPSALLFLGVITLGAVAGKLLGAGLGASLAGFTRLESLQLGAGMISRGEVGLILGAVGLQEGLLQPEQFSTLVGMVLLTTLITPPFLRLLFSMKEKPIESAQKTDIKEAG